MNRRLPRRRDVVFLCILATILALSPIAGAQRTDGPTAEKPTLIADKISYLPGETIVFSGGSWKPGEGVTIVIKTDSAGIVATIHGSADENGLLNISATMPKLPSLGSANTGGKNTPILTATAIGSSGIGLYPVHSRPRSHRCRASHRRRRILVPPADVSDGPATRPPGRVEPPNKTGRSSAGCRREQGFWSEIPIRPCNYSSSTPTPSLPLARCPST